VGVSVGVSVGVAVGVGVGGATPAQVSPLHASLRPNTSASQPFVLRQRSVHSSTVLGSVQNPRVLVQYRHRQQPVCAAATWGRAVTAAAEGHDAERRA
jgi:hypothetical protein